MKVHGICKQLNLLKPMFENPHSIRTKKQNILNQKVKSFRRQLSQSLSRVNQKSSMHTLAGSVYSQKNNQGFSPQKQRPPSANTNPELKDSSSALKGLNMRASHIPNLSEINTELLLQKRRMEERINYLKTEIARETRLRNKADTNWKLHANEDSDANHSYTELCKKSAKLNDNINDVKAENSQLNRDISQLRQANSDKRAAIAQQDENVRRMTAMVNNLKNNLMQEQKQRNFIKAELMKQQRVMDSFSIESKQLQNERAMLLLDINNSVLKNKL